MKYWIRRCQMLTDIRHSFTGTLSSKFLLKIND